MSLLDEALSRLRRSLEQIEPVEALRRQRAGDLLIDIRPPEQSAQASAIGALLLSRDRLELQLEEHVPDPSRPLLLMCGGGITSLFAVEALQRLGYTEVRSVDGGFARWNADGLPVAAGPALDAGQRQRYARHLALPEVGEVGQRRLAESSVVLIGAGGLGSAAALYLAAAGVGRLTIIDDDLVECSNLQRQVLHGDADVGLAKVESARAMLTALNPEVRVAAIKQRLSGDNAGELLAGHHAVIDGSDNFATRYLVNEVCVDQGLPNIHAAVFRFEGQLSVFWPARTGGPCYCCLYAEPPPPELSLSCQEAGVMGALPGIFGSLQASEALKILLGVGRPLFGRLLHYDALEGRFGEFDIEAASDCRVCGQR